jgi:hypothetical protein
MIVMPRIAYYLEKITPKAFYVLQPLGEKNGVLGPTIKRKVLQLGGLF